MTCYKDHKYIDYLEGLLKPKEHQSFESHLSACAPCQKILRELKLTLGQVKGMKVELPPEDYWPIFYRGISRRIQERKAAPPSYALWGWLRWLAAKPAWAAALALIVVSLFVAKLVFFPASSSLTPQDVATIKDWGEKLTVGDLDDIFNRQSPEEELQSLPQEKREKAAIKLLQTAERREEEAVSRPTATEEEDWLLPFNPEDEIDRLSPQERIWLEKRLKELA